MYKRINGVFIFEKKFIKDIVLKFKYLFPLLICTSTSYLYSIANSTISIDDLLQEYYYEIDGIKIQILRWGQVFFNRLFSTTKYSPLVNELFGVIFLLLTTLCLTSILYYISNCDNKRTYVYSAFSCIFITYPLINEYWEYYECLNIPISFFITSICIVYLLINRSSDYKDYLLIGLFMSLVSTTYESLVFAYITIVISILFLYKVIYKNGVFNWIKEGFRYAMPLFVAIILRFVIGKVVIFLVGTTASSYYGNEINWFNSDLSFQMQKLLFNGYYYFLKALCYFPITEFAICCIIFLVFIIKKQNKNSSIVIGLLLLVSLFMLPIIQCEHYGYRMAQSINFFVPLVCYLILISTKKRSVYTLICCLLSIISLRQSVFMNNYLSLNNLRSENELYIVRQLGYKIYNEYGNSKPIAFTGEYEFGNFIESQIYFDEEALIIKAVDVIGNTFGFTDMPRAELLETNVNSLINWSKTWDLAMKNYFSYCGYDIDVYVNDKNEDLDKLAKENNMKPYEILEFDDFLLVYLG